jgi:hypothetical protein
MRRLGAPVIAVGLIMSACFGPSGSLLGDIRVSWAFQNAVTCAQAGVSFVEVQIFDADDGSPQYDQVFNCTDGSVLIGDFIPGRYKFVMSGMDLSQTIRYQSSFSTYIGPGYNNLGTTVLSFTLGNIGFTWSFDGQQSCKIAGVSQMQIIVIDSSGGVEFNETRPCSDQGATITNFARGNYDLILYGLDVAGTRLFTADTKIAVQSGDNNYGNINLSPSTTTGSVTFSWTFGGGGTCTQAGVNAVKIALNAPSGQLMFSDTVTCQASSYTIVNRQPGYYDFTLTGLDNSSPAVPVYSAGPLRIEVLAGQNNLGNIDLTKL